MPVDDGGEDALEIKLPSNKLQIQMPVDVEREELTAFVFDISIHLAGNSGQYILKPQPSESGQGVAYQIHEEAQERLRTDGPEWAGRPDWAGLPDSTTTSVAAGKGENSRGAPVGSPNENPGQAGDVASIGVVK